ncbi:hypothetical protein I4U23_022602 [Adineta vaga]|nr:hypothetical protein I4U23_022602 [Adineta vaga]
MTVYPIWNTNIGGSSTPSMSSFTQSSPSSEGPANVFDGSPSNKLLQFGDQSVSTGQGLNTGFYFTLPQGSKVLVGYRFATATGGQHRVPLTVSIEGSNSGSLTVGSSWTVISNNASTGLLGVSGSSSTYGTYLPINNTIAYSSYRILVTGKYTTSSSSNCVEIGEMELCFQDNCTNGSLNNMTVNPVWKTYAGGNSTSTYNATATGSYPTNEGPANVFDGNSSTKLLQFGDQSVSTGQGSNTGFYFTLPQGSKVLIGYQFATGTDGQHRVPLTVSIEGSNSGSLTVGSSWTSISNNVPTGLLGVVNSVSTYGTYQLTYNNISYASYRILVTNKYDNSSSSNSVEIGELALCLQ